MNSRAMQKMGRDAVRGLVRGMNGWTGVPAWGITWKGNPPRLNWLGWTWLYAAAMLRRLLGIRSPSTEIWRVKP